MTTQTGPSGDKLTDTLHTVNLLSFIWKKKTANVQTDISLKLVGA